MLDKWEMKLDSFKNVLKGINVKGRDGNTRTEYEEDDLLDIETCKSLTTRNGFGKRIVNLYTGDMTREWFTVKGDVEGLIASKLNNLRAHTKIRKALRWSLGIGGSVVFMGIKDGNKPDKPVNKNNIKDIEFLKVFDRSNIWPYKIYDDKDGNYGQVEIYSIQNAGMSAPLVVHETRLLIFDGEDVTDDQKVSNDGWGYSIFQSIYPAVQDLEIAYEFVLRTIQEFRKSILKIDGLYDLLAGGQENELMTRINMLDATSCILNRELIDRNREEFDFKTASLTGLADLVDKEELKFTAITGVPATIFFGRSPQGLTSSNKGNERTYYDKVAVMQVDYMTEPLSRLIEYVMLSKEGPFKGKVLDNWEIIYVSLWQQTQEELVESRYKQMQTDVGYVEKCGLNPNIIIQSRFGGDEYSYETDLSLGGDTDIEDKPDKETKEEPDNTTEDEPDTVTDKIE